MAPGWHLAATGVLVFGIPLAFVLHELIASRRGNWNGGGGPRPPRPAPRPGDGGALRPLPACLVPIARPQGARNEARHPELV